jgi:undecaprenyl-diphosphatase
MNDRIFRSINELAGSSRFVDFIMVTLSKRTRYVYLFVLLLLLFQAKFNKRKTLIAGVTISVTYLLSMLMKRFFNKPRPFLQQAVHLLPPVPSRKDSSFPSKHTALAFAVSAFVIIYHRTWGLGLWLLSLLVGISRIWMGQHYPSDIVGSAILGNITAFVVMFTEKYWRPFLERTLRSYTHFRTSSRQIQE